MRTGVLINRINSKEVIVIWLAGIYLAFCHPLIFADRIDIPRDGGAAKMIDNADEASPPAQEWREFRDSYFIVYYKPTVSLDTARSRLNERGFYVRMPSSRSGAKYTSDEEKIVYRIDALFSRVKAILDMHPRMQVKIKIFKNREELNEEYYRIFKQRVNFKSFYVHRYETIYTSEEDLSDSVMAHEMGHAVVDHYFDVVPSPAAAEILACYVDLHLEE